MLAPGDTRYYPLVKESQYKVRSASFYIKPGYKMYVSIVGYDYCIVYLEKDEHDHQLKWPMPEIEIELSTQRIKSWINNNLPHPFYYSCDGKIAVVVLM